MYIIDNCSLKVQSEFRNHTNISVREPATKYPVIQLHHQFKDEDDDSKIKHIYIRFINKNGEVEIDDHYNNLSLFGASHHDDPVELLGYILRFNSGVKNCVLFDVPKSFERYSKSYLDIDNDTIRRLDKQINKRGLKFKVRNVFVMNSAENFVEMEMPVGVDILIKNKDSKFKRKAVPTVMITGNDGNRDKSIYDLYKKGYPTELLAVLFRMSKRQIYNIVKKQKKIWDWLIYCPQ